MTRMELLSFHALTPLDEARLNRFIASIQVVPFDQGIEAATIKLRRRTRLKLIDAIIAATAEVHGLTLLTLDERLLAASKT